MKHLFRRTLSLLLVLTLLSGLTLPAAASEALGEDLTEKETLLHAETQLATNVFWSSTYSDLRQENYITYTPNDRVTPVVLSGDVLTRRTTVAAAAKTIEAEGYRVVAGINGDFYNVSTGLPIGMVVSEGLLRSSDGGHWAVGFRADGTAVMGKPAVKVTASLGYGVTDAEGNYTEYVRQIAGVNKARVSTGGIFLYTYDFNDRHTTGTSEAGVDVVCSVVEGDLSIGSALTLRAEQVLETASATAIQPGQVVLSVNLQAGSYFVDALRNLPLGTEFTLNIQAADEAWNDVEYAVGALYPLVENGAVSSGLQAGANPRTAIGQREDGTLIFYTIDGRASGHSIGATLTQTAERLIELGCVTAVCLDGGGSTTLAVTGPESLTAAVINRPSDGSERAVTNQIFLVAEGDPSGRLSHFHVSAESEYVLAGSKVAVTVAAVDTNYIPMNAVHVLRTSDGELEDHVLTTPEYGGEITLTATGQGSRGSATVYVIETPDAVKIKNSSGAALRELTVTPGSATTLTAEAIYNHLPLKADPERFVWQVAGDIGTIGADGVFYAAAPGEGSITVTAGNTSAAIPVTVSKIPLKTLESFENEQTVFSPGTGDGIAWSLVSSGDRVRMGRGAGQLDYTLSGEEGLVAQWWLNSPLAVTPEVYTGMNLWVYGDGSGNNLSLLYDDAAGVLQKQTIALLDVAGWQQVSVDMDTAYAIRGLEVSAPEPQVYDDGMGSIIIEYADTPHTGTLYLDQMVASFGEAVDNVVPDVTLTAEGTNLTAKALDLVDGILPESAVHVTYDGETLPFRYDAGKGLITAQLPEPDGFAHRVTVTARDASGNVGRASVDVPVGEDYVSLFADTQGYWAANFIDFLYTSGITTGYADGTFRPAENISRAQFSVMLYRYLGLDEAQYANVELPFADSAKIPAYAENAVKALYTEGIINGSVGADGRLYFNPGSSLTRAQAATMIGRTQEKGYAAAELTFSDGSTIPAYARQYIQTMAAQGVLGGYTDGSFRPNNPITRGQMAKILYNLM